MMHDDMNSAKTADDITQISVKSLVGLQQAGRDLAFKPGLIRSPMAGGYRSAFKGRGMEFSESRPYQAGDDVRAIDWRVTARTGKTHTKLFEEERERPVFCLVDYRQPMFFATQGCLKSVLAAKLAALLGWSAHFSGDRIGGLIFSEQQHLEIRPLRGQSAVLNWIHHLVSHSAWQPRQDSSEPSDEHLVNALIRLRKVILPGSLVFLLSDFRALSKAAEQQLALLSRHNSVSLVFLYDAFEAALPQKGRYPLQYAGRHVVINAHQKSVRDTYEQRFQEKTDSLKHIAHRFGCQWHVCQTTTDVAKVFTHP